MYRHITHNCVHQATSVITVAMVVVQFARQTLRPTSKDIVREIAYVNRKARKMGRSVEEPYAGRYEEEGMPPTRSLVHSQAVWCDAAMWHQYIYCVGVSLCH